MRPHREGGYSEYNPIDYILYLYLYTLLYISVTNHVFTVFCLYFAINSFYFTQSRNPKSPPEFRVSILLRMLGLGLGPPEGLGLGQI